MKTLKQGLGKALALVLTGAALTSCTAQGQHVPKPVLPELADLPHWKVFRNYSSHNAAFFERLMFGRAFIFERPSQPDVVEGQIVSDNGSVFWCSKGKASRTYSLALYGLTFEMRAGAARTLRRGGGTYRSLIFFDPDSGTLREEYLASHDNPHKRHWVNFRSGWVQDSWPRVLADACPMAALAAGMAINEKQTSRNLDELRRQDPNAPIRNFPGSHLTAPGLTGLGASGGRPTTTKEEVRRFLIAQAGNVIISAAGDGHVFSYAGGGNEVWRLGEDGGIAQVGEVREEGDWLIVEVPGQPVLRYPVGYPVPVLPTGHRYAAFQLTDHLVAGAKAHALGFMGEAYADRRFVFIGNGVLSVVDRQGELAAGAGFEGTWRWTAGRLEIRVAGDGEARSIAWRDLAAELGVTPSVWTPSTPDRH